MADTIPGDKTTRAVLDGTGQRVTGVIDAGNDTDWYQVFLIVGYSYQISLHGMQQEYGTLADPWLGILDYSGSNYLDSNDDVSGYDLDAYINFAPPTTGIYFVSAEAATSSDTGSYTLFINQDQLDNANTGAWLASGSAVYGSVGWPKDDSDWYAVTLTAGTAWQFDLSGTSTAASPDLVLKDPFLMLRDANGESVAVDDDSGLGRDARLVYTPTVSGTYYVDVQSYGYDYGLYTLRAGVRPQPVNLALDTPLNAALGYYGEYDLYSVTLTAGRSYGFNLLGGTLTTPFLELQSPSGDVIKYDNYDDTGTDGDAYISFTPDTSGSYLIAARHAGNSATGTYSISATEVPAITVKHASASEGDDDSGAVVFTLSLSFPAKTDVTVQVDTTSGTAWEEWDFEAVHRTVTIAAGQTEATLSVPVFGNDWYEPDRGFELLLSNSVGADVYAVVRGVIKDDDAPVDLARPSDELYGQQWHLYNIRAAYAWELATGAGIKVGIFDQGIDSANADLSANTQGAMGRTALTLGAGGAPVLDDDNHGTWVAGVVGAARDGKGTVGVAYDAQLISLYTPDVYSDDYLVEIRNAFTYAQSLDVLNDSWGFGNLLQSDTGWAFLDNANDAEFAPAFQALKELASKGRGGLGTNVVQSAGNSFSFGDDTNLHNFQNSRYIVTVGATDFFGLVSSFSTTGASILVAAPGGAGTRDFHSILTTDRSGSAGDSDDDFAFVDGTSFSAPIVSGVIALMLEVNPGLGYRDVQKILAYTAKKIDAGGGAWDFNGAHDWNGGGLRYNSVVHSSGFGEVDALAAVRLAAAWSGPAQTVANTKELIVNKLVDQLIPDNDTKGLSSAIVVSEAMLVERVDVAVNITHSFVGDLKISLTSPAGTVSNLLWRPSQGVLSAFGSSQSDIHFTFDTVLDWGETSVGTWTLTVIDADPSYTGTLTDWTLDLIGKPTSQEQTFVYTNEFPDLVAADPARGVLSAPSGGNYTINAGALGLDCRIDLSGATPSTLNEATLTIAPGTVIQNAAGGDGDDTLIANALGGVLRGMGGDDLLTAGLGRDTLDGGRGTDTVAFPENFSHYQVSHGEAGAFTVANSQDASSDALTHVERLKFADFGLAFDAAPTEHAGQAALLIGAVLGHNVLGGQKALLGAVIGLLDQGMSFEALCGAAMRLPIWDQLAGGSTDAQIATWLLTTVHGAVPTPSALAAAQDALAHQAQGLFLADLALSAANQTQIDLVGLATAGIEFA